MHLHELFCINPYGNKGTVDKCVGKIFTHPMRFDLFKSLKVLILEEASLLDHWTMNTIDLILQRIKENQLPFGGVILILSGDPFQLSVKELLCNNLDLMLGSTSLTLLKV